jgi:hypothetical protein
MTDKEQQLKHFRDAVDRKAEASQVDNPSRSGPPPEERGEEGPQRSLTEPGRPQDVDPQHKSSRKGHVTADKWNQ